MKPRLILRLALLLFGISVFVQTTASAVLPYVEKPVPTSATVPLHIEFNRPFIDLDFRRADGTTRKARFWVDTGGGGFIVTEPLAKELGLKMGEVFKEGRETMAGAEAPSVSVGGMPLDMTGARCFVAIGSKTMMPGVDAEGLFPGHILRRYHVVFDYPGRKFTLAKPGRLKPRGTPLPTPIGKTSGFPRIEMSVAGETHGFLLDTGASYTMVSQELLSRWTTQYKDWKQTTGAVGAANMGLGQAEARGLQVRVQEARLANFAVGGFACISRPKGTFENYMSNMMSSPIVGAIGGNLLQAFRVEIDYANGMTYLEKKREINPNDADMVGLTLQPKDDGTYVIVAVSDQNDKAVVESVRPNDKLIRVDRLDVRHQPMAKVVESLAGTLQAKRSLVLEREGKQFTVIAPVVRIL